MKRLTAKRSRNLRTPTQTFSGKLHPRALNVLLTLSEFELMRSTWLFAFDGGQSKGRFLNLLTFLFHETGFIERPDQQQNAFNALYSPTVYRLSERGHAYLRQEGYAALQAPSKVGPFAHNLLASDILADIKRAIDAAPGLRYISKQEILAGAPSATRARRNPFALPVSISHEFGGRRVAEETSYVADGWFGIEFQGGGRRYHCLEVNLGANVRAKNLTDASHLRKFLSVRALRHSNGFAQHLGLTAPVIALFVQNDPATTQNSMGLLEELSANAGSAYFAFKSLPTFQQQECAPLPTGHTVFKPWHRVGFGPLYLSQP
jgi:hypothetical protein